MDRYQSRSGFELGMMGHGWYYHSVFWKDGEMIAVSLCSGDWTKLRRCLRSAVMAVNTVAAMLKVSLLHKP